MKKIFKYQLPFRETYDLVLPVGSEIIRVDDVGGLFYLWAIVDPEEDIMEPRFLEMYKTGQEIKTDTNYLKYLGIMNLFIGQELCLYVFENCSQMVNKT